MYGNVPLGFGVTVVTVACDTSFSFAIPKSQICTPQRSLVICSKTHQLITSLQTILQLYVYTVDLHTGT